MSVLSITLSGILQRGSGTHLLSHAVSSIVPSAAYVLTVVFGMGTGVSHRRIGTGIIRLSKEEEVRVLYTVELLREPAQDDRRT